MIYKSRLSIEEREQIYFVNMVKIQSKYVTFEKETILLQG
jgi:hypothetical protein